jgi:hypothetical protein
LIEQSVTTLANRWSIPDRGHGIVTAGWTCDSHIGCRQTVLLAKVFATGETLASDELTEFATGEKLKPNALR